MGSVPKIGRDLGSVREELRSAPQDEVLGTVNPQVADPAPQGSTTAWETAGHQVDMSDPPPPWELEGDGSDVPSDARRYVDVPENWTLRWINPKLLESTGWRYWQPVMGGDPRVKLKVTTMLSPDGNIRRGGQTGDILGWMLTPWVESRRRLHQEKTALLTQSAVDRQETLREEFKRGTYGPYVKLEGAKHPTHTMLQGKEIREKD